MLGGASRWGESCTRADIDAYQLARLRETVAWARERGPFYRAFLADHAVPATLEDFRRLPFTTAQDLCHDPLGFLCVSQSEIRRVVTLETSGTTGTPKRLFFTAGDLETTLDFFHHGLSLMAGPGDSILIMLPGTVPDSVGDLLMRAAPRLGATAHVHGMASNPLRAAEAMECLRPDLVIGVPVQLLAVARAARSAGLSIGPLKSVLLCTDYSADSIVRELEQAWDAKVFQHWGMTEMGYGGGVQCAAHDGYHLQEADFLFEIIDPSSGAPLPHGETGEVVLTTLTRQGMPLIRYRTGDLSRFIPSPCPCGWPIHRLDRVRCRLCTQVDIGNGRMIAMSQLDEALLGTAGLNDFSATLVTGQPNRLRIAALPPFPRADGTATDAVHGALLRLEAIRKAVAAGDLVIEASLLTWPLPFTRAKRVIAVEGWP